MRAPKSVNILGKTFKIRRRPMRDKLGNMDLAMQRIKLDIHQVKQQKQDSLLHEVLHAIDESLKFELKEHQVHGLAAALLQVIWDNPKLMRYLQK